MQNRMAPAAAEASVPVVESKSSLITITTTGDADGQVETHNILVTTTTTEEDTEDHSAEEGFKGEELDFMLSLSPQPAAE